MATNLEQASNSPETKYDKIKKLLDKGGSLKDGIKDEKGNLQIFMEGNKIIRLDDVYDLKIIAKTLIADIDTNVLDISVNGEKVKITTDKGDGEISREQFNKAIEGGVKTGSYINDINGKHIEFKKVATINRPNPAVMEAQKTGKSAEVMGTSESQRAQLLAEVQKKGIDIKNSDEFLKLDNGSIKQIEEGAGFLDKVVDKVKGFFSAMGERLRLLFEGNFSGRLSAFLLGTGLKKEEKKTEEEKTEGDETQEKKKLDEENNKKNRENAKFNIYKYNIASRTLSTLFTQKGADKAKVDLVFNQTSFKELNFNDAIKHFNNYNIDKNYDLSTKLGLKNAGFKNNDIFAALRIIVKGESREIINKRNPKALLAKMKVGEAISGIYSELGDAGKLTSFTAGDANDIKGFLERNDFGLGIENKDGKFDIKGGMKEKAIELGLSNELIIYSLQSKNNIGQSKKELVNSINSEDNNLSDNDKTKLENEIIPFGLEIQKAIISDNRINLGCDISGAIKNNPLSFKELLELYVTTGGHKNYNSMNTFEKVSLNLFLAKKLEGYDNGKYLGKIGDLATGGIEGVEVPEEVENFFKTIYNGASNSLFNSAKSGASWIAGLGIEHPIAAAAIIGYMIFGKWIPVRQNIGTFVSGK